MRKNATKLAAAVLSLAMVMTSVSMPASAATTKKAKLNKTKATLYTNGTKTTTLKVLVGKKSVKATFKSSNTKILTVGKTTGKVTAKKNGTAKVTATYKGKSYKCTVTVKTYATSITSSTKTINLEVGKTATIKKSSIKVSPSTASNKTFNFTSSDKSVATVGLTGGKVTAKKAGTAKIYVTALGSKGKAKKATVTVNVKKADVTPTETPLVTETPVPTETPSVATEGTVTVTTNISGASIKVVSGSQIMVAGTATGVAFTTEKLDNGTYTVIVSKEGYKDATREVVVNGDVDVDIQLEKLAEPTAATATIIGAKKVQVVLDAPATTATSPAVTIKKGVVSVNTDKVTLADDKKTFTVETSAKLTKGDYTITVSGVASKDITTTLTAADEKVAKINVTTKTAPYVVYDNVVSKSAISVQFKVLNQYDEDVTSAKGPEVTWSSASGVTVNNNKASDGLLTLKNTTEYIPNAKVYLTGVHANSGTVVNAEVSVGVESRVDQVVFKGVYNTKTKKFENLPANFENDKYVLLFDVNDQYGNKMAANAKLGDDLLFTSNNPLFVDADLTGISTTEVDDTTYMSVALKKGTMVANGGKVTIQVISKQTGKTASYEINAEAASQLKTFTISAPNTMVALGEKVEIPFTALDQNGKAITKFDDLNGKVDFPKNLAFEENLDGTAKLMFKANDSDYHPTDTTDAPVYLTSLVKNVGNFSSVMVNVKAAAKATTVVGLNKDVLTSISDGNSTSFNYEKIVLQDQYGRTMTKNMVDAWLQADDTYNTIVIESEKPENDDKTPFEVATNGTDTQKISIDNSSKDSTTVTVKSKAGTDLKATEKLTIYVTKQKGSESVAEKVAGSEKSVTFTKVGQSEYKSYVVDDLGTMYNNADASTITSTNYDKTVKAYGVKEDGTKVLLPASADYYEVTIADDVKLTANKTTGVITDDKTGASGYDVAFFKDDKGNTVTKTVKVNVTFFDKTTGAVVSKVTKDLVLSSEAPKVATIALTDDVKNGKAGIEAAADGAITYADLMKLVKASDVKDQYGVAWTNADTNANVTISKVTKADGSEFNVTKNTNGTTNTAITGAKKGDKFTVTYAYGDKSVDVEITVTGRAS